MITTFGNTDFVANIEAELDAVSAFLKILQLEQETLVNGEFDPLTDLAQQKTFLVKQLTEFAAARNHYLRSQGFSADRYGMEEWLKKSPSSRQAKTMWKDLVEAAETAYRLNHTNGVLINSRMRHNQKALSLLHSAVKAIDLYGPNGQTAILGTGRPLGSV